MRRVLALIGAALLILLLATPVLALDQPVTPPGRVLIAIGGDLTVPKGEVAQTAIVIQGTLDVQGTVDTVVVIDGTASVRGTTIGDLVVVGGRADVTDTTVRNDIRTLDAQVTQEHVTVGGTVRGLEQELARFAWVIGISAILIWVGVGIATLVAGLALAGLAGRQVRSTTALIRREPVPAFLAGILGVILPPVVFGLAMATIVGIPLGLGALLVVWPALAFVGYLVAAVLVGEWALSLGSGASPVAERPYRATIVGLVVLFVAGFIPLVTAIASLFGLGGVLLAGWRTLQGGAATPVLRPTAMPA